MATIGYCQCAGVSCRHAGHGAGSAAPCILWHPKLAPSLFRGLILVDAFTRATLIERMWPRYESAVLGMRGDALHLCAASARILASVPPPMAMLSNVVQREHRAQCAGRCSTSAQPDEGLCLPPSASASLFSHRFFAYYSWFVAASKVWQVSSTCSYIVLLLYARVARDC